MDEPVDGSAVGALVVVPSFARESVVPFRRLRALAVRAADAGYVVLSVFLGGDGESSSIPESADLVAEWGLEVDAAVAAAVASVPRLPVSVVGWRLGAALTYRHLGLAAASDTSQRGHGEGGGSRDGAAPLASGTPITGRALLWEPVSGASFVRQHQHLRRFASPVKAVEGGVEFVGAYLSDAQVASLRGLKAPKGAAGTEAFSILREPDPKSLLQLTLGSPHFVHIDMAAIDAVVASLDRGESAPFLPVPERLTATWDEAGCRISESIVEVGPYRLSGVLTRSVDTPATRGVLFTAIGSELRSGPGGTWSESARDIARDGVMSLRVDRRTLGEDTDVSEAREPYPYTDESVEDVLEAAEYVAAQVQDDILGVGACSGAWSVLRGSAKGRFGSILAVNPVHWDPDARNYDDDFYERTYRSEGMFSQVLASAGASGAEDGNGAEGADDDAATRRWQVGIHALLHRLAIRFPRLRGFVRGDRSTDRVGALLRLLGPKAHAILAMGPGEEAIFRAKGGNAYLARSLRSDLIEVRVSEHIDHSLFSLRSRQVVQSLIRDIVQRQP
ncbi:MAG: hypothetical protein Q4G51_07050 [Dermatophilus congolensis]|nr:hypothetical protein [Dermatophilus congolensis]